ncbi:glycine/betaine ABC transporter [Lactobacillus sp. S2-2]|uniref:glycine betaine ABC transporter substrate-binding protein n=1 Tax=Lactobacillus sp. S2-2 TaxID=2692917 RepID=UPI001F9A34F2|nr:glycine betaine ABC transporter substrate-binding protein [Lactobacillus sp. S2-2]MCF6514695.1 glycine/betaine ABC transporter [Lactobacillus sp. S2-2]
MRKKFIVLISIFIILVLILFGLSKINTTPPKYNAQKPIGEQLNYTIVGIEAGAGLMSKTQEALTRYPNLQKNHWQLMPSSTASMISSLDKSIKYKQPIVVLCWQPHWIFKKYKLKFLKDPKHVYSKGETITTITNKKMRSEKPGAFKLLQQFKWTPSDMSTVMMDVTNGMKPNVAAQKFIKKHPDLVKKWLKNVPNGHGQSVKLSYVAWDSEIASTNLVMELLKYKGYNASIYPMEIQPMWISVATGSIDASLSAWLPQTSKPLYDQYKNKIDIAGESLHGAKAGLIVPKYMKNINSIEDLNK